MISATVLAVFFVPMFFVAVLRWLRVRPQSADNEVPAATPALPQGGS
jgi:multidrug efflux pump